MHPLSPRTLPWTRRTALAALGLGLGLRATADTTPGFELPPGAVRVQRQGDRFSVEADLHAPVASATAWAVLVDFEHMPSYQPELRSSTVTERQGQHLVVRQTGVMRYGPFSSDVESVRELQLQPPRLIRAHGIGGQLKQMDSVTTVDAEPGGTHLNYRAQVEPGFWFPPLVGPAMVQEQTARQFSALVREMLRREETGAGSTTRAVATGRAGSPP